MFYTGGDLLKCLRFREKPGIYYSRLRGHRANLRNPMGFLFVCLRSQRLCTIYSRPLPGPLQGARLPLPDSRPGESSPGGPPATWRRPANQRGASVVLATVASKLRRSPVSCKLGYYCFSDTSYSRASAHTHTHTHIYTRSSAPAPRAATMDDSKEEYEAAFRSLLRKLTLSSRESTPPPGSPRPPSGRVQAG